MGLWFPRQLRTNRKAVLVRRHFSAPAATLAVLAAVVAVLASPSPASAGNGVDITATEGASFTKLSGLEVLGRDDLAEIVAGSVEDSRNDVLAAIDDVKVVSERSARLLTVLVDLTLAIEVGMVLAAFLFMRRMAEVTNVSALTHEFRDPQDDFETDPNAVRRRTVILVGDEAVRPVAEP